MGNKILVAMMCAALISGVGAYIDVQKLKSFLPIVEKNNRLICKLALMQAAQSNSLAIKDENKITIKDIEIFCIK